MATKAKQQETLKQSIGFSAIGSIGTQVISLVSFIVLARLLSPHEFGLMAMVSIFTSFAAIFIEMGMGSALIHNQKSGAEHFSTAFWFNMLLAGASFALVVLSSGFVAEFFHEPELKNVLLVAGWLLPLNALSIVPMAILQKQQLFKKVAIIELGSLACGVIVALFLASRGAGVWALVANLLVIAFVKSLLLFIVLQWRPQLLLKRNALRELWSYSGYLMGTGIANYFITNVDSALVGRLMGSFSLGAYKYAYQLATLPGTLVSSIFARVLFSSYVTYKEDKEKIKRIHFKAVRMIAFFTFPSLLILAAISDKFVFSVLGEKWMDMASILSFMCVIFLLDSIGGMNNPLFLSQGKTKSLFWLTVILRSNLILAMIIGIQFGLNGLLWGLLLAKLINFLPVYVIVGKTIGFSVFDFICNIFTPFILSIFVSGIVIAMQYFDVISYPPLESLILLISFAVIVYLALALLFQRETLLDIRSIVFRRASI